MTPDVTSTPETRTVNRRILLARRPEGAVTEEDLRYVEEPIPELEPGKILLKNRYISLDPATRGWMDDKASYMEPIPIDGVMRGSVVSEVIASTDEAWLPGDFAAGIFGWEDYTLAAPNELRRRCGAFPGLDPVHELSLLGGTGLTAWIGLHRVAQIKPGETVVVSAASGSVGSLAGQLAKRHGCRVVGITGGAHKAEMLREVLGFDDVVDYQAGPIYPALKAACPKGIDVYFDNVGGEALDAALGLIRVHARVVLCGAISQINERTLPPGPKNYIRLLARRARMEGFITLDYASEWDTISGELAELVMSGQLQVLQEVVDGLAALPSAFARLFRGEKVGKLVVMVS